MTSFAQALCPHFLSGSLTCFTNPLFLAAILCHFSKFQGLWAQLCCNVFWWHSLDIWHILLHQVLPPGYSQPLYLVDITTYEKNMYTYQLTVLYTHMYSKLHSWGQQFAYIGSCIFFSWPGAGLTNRVSVATTQVAFFAIFANKLCKITKIFEGVDPIKSRWVLCQL